MDTILLFSLIIIVVIACLWPLSCWLLQRKHWHREIYLEKEIVKLSAENKQLANQIEYFNSAKEKLEQSFNDLANRIFEEKNSKFSQQNQTALNHLLLPLREQLKDFNQKIHESYDKESRERLSLGHEIKSLKTLNQKMSEEAINLTNALKGNVKIQGCWGELVLERCLESSGLQKNLEFATQVSYRNKQGKLLQPDVVLNLPDEKKLILDAKVSLQAYTDYLAVNDDQERAVLLRQHVQSIKNHIKSLSEKNYQNIPEIKTLDFVLLFIPIEAAFITAMQSEANLYQSALKNNIVITTPTTLLTTLRLIENIWRYDKQNKHALKIAEQAGNLYDKFVNIHAELEDMGKRITLLNNSYHSIMGKLKEGKGNLIMRVEKLKDMGAKASKSLPKATLLDVES